MILSNDHLTDNRLELIRQYIGKGIKTAILSGHNIENHIQMISKLTTEVQMERLRVNAGVLSEQRG